MVRINIINTNLLSDEHLIAEWNELRILYLFIKKYPKLSGKEPESFTLNKGHMLFFKNKLLYLQKRHLSIYTEMLKRGINANKEYLFNCIDYPDNLKNNWNPIKEDFEVIIQRITERLYNPLRKRSLYKFYGKQKSPEFFEDLMLKT